MIAIHSISDLVSTNKGWPIYLATYVLLLLSIQFFELLRKYASMRLRAIFDHTPHDHPNPLIKC
jgi:hypothetical protein